MEYNFVNPYNFMPLTDRKAIDNSEERKFSGVIKYSVLTKTPLMITDTAKEFTEMMQEGKEHKHCVFMSLNNIEKYGDKSSELTKAVTEPDTPFVPGSQMRGMLRSVYEMLTDSCLSVLNDSEVLSKRTHEVFKAGVLCKERDGSFTLYSADDCIFRALKTGSVENASENAYRQGKYSDTKTKSYLIDSEKYKGDYHEGQRIYFLRNERERGKNTAKNLSLIKNDLSKDEGYLIKGEVGPEMGNNNIKEKHNCHIFYKTQSIVRKNVSLSCLEKVLRIYSDNNGELYKEYRKYLDKFRKDGKPGDCFPVYYSIVKYSRDIETDCFLSPAAITREVYSKTIGKVVKKGGFNPCSDNSKLCPACALFGTVATQEKAVASRLRFSDLRFVRSSKGDKPDYTGAVTLIPLSTPKISNMEFYLKRPANDALFWTYDYYVTTNGKINENNSGINGRKFYWHSHKLLTTKEKNEQNKTVYPLNEGNVFEGKLYFDSITETELNRLWYLLNCGEEENTAIDKRRHCYKLGAAKPAGLGSIAVKADCVLVRDCCASDGKYTVEEWKPGKVDFGHIEDFRKMTDFSQNYNVDYPRKKCDGDVFAWFAANNKGVNRNKYNNIEADRKGNIIKNMPNSRDCEYLEYHMEAMEPVLKKTELPGIRNNFGDRNRTNGGTQNKYGNSYKNRKK